MQIKNWRQKSFLFIIFGIIQYIIFTLIAMLFYAGGTLADPLSTGYDFWGNLFSDLGRIIALSGHPNTIAFIIFTISAIIFSISFIPFTFALPDFFKGERKQFNIIIIATGVGLISISSLIGTILTPWDVFGGLHLLFANIFNIMGSLVLLLYAIAILYNDNYPNIYAIVYLILLIFGIIYSIILMTIPKSISTETLTFQATMQKISQYSFLFCFLIQGFGAWKIGNINLKSDVSIY
ncbi:MAG: hypothetical protein ACTSPN_07960 [Promethearchaeota archaeon]